MTPTRQPSDTTASPADGEPSEGRVRLRLYNTLTRRKEDFAPIDRDAVRLYVCGPTVYDFAHIGNARPIIVFDVLFRLLRHIYGADHVIYVRNITDVDDKINARAERDYPDLPLNEAIAKVTVATERQFHEDVAALGALAPTEEPRATQYIGKMRAMIERLVARGVAYVAEDHVLFSPSAMDKLPGAPRYGTLAHRALDEMLAGARVDVAPYKRDPMDFVLWKPSKPNEPGWPSPAGIAAPGRPAGISSARRCRWRRCSSRSAAASNATTRAATCSTFTAAGSISSFPTTRTRSRSPAAPSARRGWPTSGSTTASCRSKARRCRRASATSGTIRELLDTKLFGSQIWPGEVLRLAMLGTHYRQPINFTQSALEEARQKLNVWYHAIGDDAVFKREPSSEVINALSDDLNTHEAIKHLDQLAGGLRAIRSFNREPSSEKIGELKAGANLLGLLRGTQSEYIQSLDIDVAEIDRLVAQRSAARTARNWAESDRLRDELAALGVAIKDNKDGTTSLGAEAMSAVALRPYLPADAKLCAEIFRASIEELAAEDYDEDQREAWASTSDDEAAFRGRLEGALTLIAAIDGATAGFGSLKDGEKIDMLVSSIPISPARGWPAPSSTR